MGFTPDIIDAIRERCDLVALVGAVVELRKSGRRFVGLCPFHAEKTPSFSVAADKNLFHCFGCQAGGDAFAFVMRHEGIDFTAAVRKLADRCGVQVEPESPEVMARRQAQGQVATVNAAARAFFVQQLAAPAGEPARAYLRRRQLPMAFAQARALGFGGSGEALLAHLVECGHSAAAAQDAGLMHDDGRRHLFAGRLVFPIVDAEGRVAGFGGRRLGDEPQVPKYINSRDSALFAKGRLLYGLETATDASRRSHRVVVVEGYTDVLAAQRAGIAEAVAALGTAFTADHAALCKRLARRALVVLDGDAAGRRASLKVSIALLQAGLETSVVALPAGEDPDSWLRKCGARGLQQHLEGAQPAVAYFMEQAFAAADLPIEARAAAARDMQPLLAALGSGLERELYMSRLAQRVGVTVEQLRRHLVVEARGAAKRPPRPPPSQPKPADAAALGPPGKGPTAPPAAPQTSSGPQADAALVREREMVRELLLFPQLRARLGELAEYALSPQIRALLAALAESEAPLELLLEKHISDLPSRRGLQRVRPLADMPEDALNEQSNRTFDDVLAGLKRRHIEAALQCVLHEIQAAEARGEATDTILRRKQELTARKRALRRLGVRPVQ